MEKPNRFTLDSFKQAMEKMVATGRDSFDNIFGDRQRVIKTTDYTEDEIKNIINSGSLTRQQQLSYNYFLKDGFYKRLLTHYATMLKYCGLVIPNTRQNSNISAPHVAKRYTAALNLVETMQVADFESKCALTALIFGTYYGVKIEQDKKVFAILDLPPEYCCSRFKDLDGNDLIEFDVSYFNSISDQKGRDEALRSYPKVISDYYDLYRRGKTVNKWVMVPSEIGICFPFFEGRPFFLDVIPAAVGYDVAVANDREKDLEEIKKILVQKIPHLNDGTLLFEPEEAAEMHSGAVGMMKKNKHVSVLTTYADVDSIVSKTGAEGTVNTLEKSVNNIYYKAGTSGQLFGSNSNLSLETSIKNDMAMMMMFVRKMDNFITNTINLYCANSNINFKYVTLPVTYYNDKEYIDNALKLAQNGYSFIVPCVASGISQRDLMNLKSLETDLLELDTKLIPLQTSYTQSGAEGEAGAPPKSPEKKSEKTVKNIQAQEGGSN